MSILNYFRRKDSADNGLFLPAPQHGSEEDLPCEIIESANSAVGELASDEPAPKRRKTTIHTYDAKVRAQISKYTSQNDPQAAVNHFSKSCGHKIPESTLRKFRDAYLAELKRQTSTVRHGGAITISSLPTKPKGMPLKLGDLDWPIQSYIRKLRAAGGIINADVVVASATGVVLSKNRALLKQYGGSIVIERSWAKSLLTRMKFTKRKGSTAAKLPLAEFENIKSNYLEKIKAFVDHGIVPQMVINWDQTALRLVPHLDWTMEEWGTKKITIKGLDDKHEITVLLAITLSGELLPPQLLYQGKSDRCHPDVNFPCDWDIWHMDNHWFNEYLPSKI